MKSAVKLLDRLLPKAWQNAVEIGVGMDVVIIWTRCCRNWGRKLGQDVVKPGTGAVENRKG